MKKLVLVLIIAVIAATGAFAQFGVGGGILSDLSDDPYVTLDFSFDVKKISVMWGTTFLFNLEMYSGGGGSSYSDIGFGWGLYGGVAFKVLTVDKWTVYIPILMDFGLTINTSTAPYAESETYFTIGLLPGVRAKYAFNKNWGLITGFQFYMFQFRKHPTIGSRSHSGFTFWGGGEAILAFRYTIGK